MRRFIILPAALCVSLLGCDGSLEYTREIDLVQQDDRVPFA